VKFVLVSISFLVLAQAQDGTLDYSVVSDVRYCTGGGKPLLMDVFVPRRPLGKPAPAVLWLDGGGWERGDKNGNSGALFLASAGFVTASIFYRLSGDAKFPAAIEDSKCAIRYLRANAKQYGIDPNRIGVAGASSGGHLALLAGAANENAGLEGAGGWPKASSRVKAVSSYYGPTDFTQAATEYGERGRTAIIKFLGVAPDLNPEAYRRASPISYVSRETPPILMVHGDSDQLVPHGQSKRMLDACVRQGVDARLVTVANADHDFEPRIAGKPLSISVEEIHALTIEFFKKRLRSELK
jgi:acetyl esterase/lipase